MILRRFFFSVVVVMVGLGFVTSTALANATSGGTPGWVQFPSNDSNGTEYSNSARLALTASGSDVSMTYTPATYELQKLPDEEAMYLQIHDAVLSEESRHDVGSAGVMDLVFSSPSGGEWSVYCGANKLADSGSAVVSVGAGVCGFAANSWSNALKITPPAGSDRLLMKTVWHGSDAEQQYGDQPTGYENLVNVFRLQSWNGVVRLAATDPGQISYADGKALHFPSHLKKSEYEPTVNWAVAYKTIQEGVFSFEVDVSDITSDYLYLWDKDADANRLFLEKGKTVAAQAPDDGISMLVRWSDGTPITKDPEWTNFDQTNREGFLPHWDDGSETNHFDGPSWDSGQDPHGYDSIRWYKIPLGDRLSDSVTVTWSGSSVPLNAFAFAASGPVAPAPCSTSEKCSEQFEEIEGPPPSSVFDVLPEDCVLSGFLKACISSTPLPDPSEESFGLDPHDEEKNTISYNLIFENVSPDEQLEEISIFFSPPHNTTLLDSYIPFADPDDGGVYAGKGEAKFSGPSELSPGQVFIQSLGVSIDPDTGMSDFDISSDGSFAVETKESPRVQLPELIHHVGTGGAHVQVERCYAINYVGGDFSCRQSCEVVAPGAILTVRDLLTNHGGEIVSDYQYLPSTLPNPLEFVPHSVRLDDPEFGIPVQGGGTFPPEDGITITGQMRPQGSRALFFQYAVPDEIEGDAPEERCFGNPESPEEPEHVPECAIQTDSGSSHGSICVSIDPDPELQLELAAVPGEGKTVYQGSPISYFLTVTNVSRQPVSRLQIRDLVPAQTICTAGECTALDRDDPAELSQQFGSLVVPVQVQVLEAAQGSSIIHPGALVRFQGENGSWVEQYSNPIEHALVAIPEPSGDFRHDISLSRRTVLNAAERSTPRADQADKTVVSHRFAYDGTHKTPVWPDLSGSRHHQYNVCNLVFRSYESYDADFNSYSYVYNASSRLPLSSFDQLGSRDVDFQISTAAPAERPELLVVPEDDHDHQFRFPMSGSDRGRQGLNAFLQQGGVIDAAQLDETLLRSVRDGVAGQIDTENIVISAAGEGQIREDLWQYSQYSTRRDRNRCLFCTSKGCFRYDAHVPLYRWEIASSRVIPLRAADRDYVTSLTSVAWLQTKNGHLGFGTPFWTSAPGGTDPNVVDLGDASISTLMKFYTPPGEANADLLIYSPGADPLQSGLGEVGRVSSQNFEQGFIPSPHDSALQQLSRGEAYDRQENPREYFDDLIHRELYGRVVQLQQGELLPGMRIVGTELRIEGRVPFESDTIYYWQGPAALGDGSSDVIIDGGKARLVIDGDARVLSNVRYSTTSDADLAQIPSLRLHTLGDIVIHPAVTDVELMMLAEDAFHSGRSDRQLRILGDVIALRAFWERSPLNAERADEEMVNKPSELIYEDFRKYLLTPPGDKKLPDAEHVWREVNPATGEPIWKDLYEQAGI